ncbi:MAG: hypothetical protein FJ096_22960, partial [Deltaproteobacteria bacterium]|nr:hypothetical protein [Deltaproteobacteria bacterium]
MKRELSVGVWLGLLGVAAQLGAAEPTPAERAEAAAKQLRDEAAKAEAAAKQLRDEAAKAEAALPE